MTTTINEERTLSKENDFVDSNLTTKNDGTEEIIEQFVSFFPKSLQLDISDTKKSKKKSEEKINNANESIEEKIVDAFVASEEQKTSRQKPIANYVLIIFAMQLIAFNLIMFFIVYKTINHFETHNFLEIIEFLKYYVGAVVVELIALVTIIVKGSFTLKSNSIVEQIVKRKNKDEN